MTVFIVPFPSLQVDEVEGRTLAIQHNSQFHEVSVAENSPAIYSAIDTVLNECRSVQNTQKTRKFSVSKMIGTLIGNTNGKVVPNANQGGTVVVCHKSDLYKSRVLRRRQNFTATASLWLSEKEEQVGTARWTLSNFCSIFLSFMRGGHVLCSWEDTLIVLELNMSNNLEKDEVPRPGCSGCAILSNVCFMFVYSWRSVQ